MNSEYGPKIQLIVASMVANNFPDSKVALIGGHADRVEIIFDEEPLIYFDDEGTQSLFENEKKYWKKYEGPNF
jgi:hypothetical protein